MMTSMFAGVTGLRNHQTRMDVIGNNIANVNTVAFKGSRVVFQDMFSQTIKDASGPQGGSGGNNANQIGVGMSLANIDVLHTRTSGSYTGAPLDSMIEGDGYYVVGDGTKILDGNGDPTDFSNTDAFRFTRAGNFYVIDNILLDSNGLRVQQIVLDADGEIPDPANPQFMDITLPTDLVNVSINQNGEIWGVHRETGKKTYVATIAMSNFENNNGLEKIGNNLYRQSASSGDPKLGRVGDNGTGLLNPGMLEMSNVDLANEFTNMIITQRGFQANSRIITVSDQMLEELVNIKR